MRKISNTARWTASVSAIVAAGLLAPVVPAFAQSADTVGAEGSEIVVTATKRAERLIEVPLAISVIGSGDMASQNLVSIKDYVARVPGLSMSDAGNGQVQIAIRGLTTGGLTNSTVGVTVDDIPVGGSTATSYGALLVPELDPAMIERIEVLKGPQGTLYGASTLGGLLRYVTVQPKFDQVSGMVAVGGTNTAHGESGYGVRGLVNLPLSENAAVLASGFYRRDPGYVDDPSRGLKNINSQDVYGGRIALRWQATENLSVKLAALLQNVEGDGTAQIDSDANLVPLAGYTQSRLPQTGPYNRKIRLYSAQFDLDLGFATLTSLTGYNQSKFRSKDDVDTNVGYIARAATGDPTVAGVSLFSVNTKKIVQEVRLASPTGDTFEWMVGGFYTHEKSNPLYNLVAVVPATGAIVADDIFVDRYPSKYRELAAFVNATYKFTDQFDVQLGGRYGGNKQSFHETIGGPLLPGYDVRTKSKENVFTYSVSPRFRIDRSMTLYARVASGYRPGGPNTAVTPTTPESYGSDTTTNYEIGFKGEFLDRALYIEASVFRIDWKDIQLQQIDPPTSFVYFDNAGGARSEGFEFSAVVNPTRLLKIEGNVAYAKARLTDDAPLISGAPTAGSRLPFSAPWTASLSVDQKIPLGDEVEASIGGTVAYQDKRRGIYQNYGQANYPSYTTLDLRAAVKMSDWTASAFVSNVFDKAVAIAGDWRAPGSTLYQTILNRPRTIGVQLERKF